MSGLEILLLIKPLSSKSNIFKVVFLKQIPKGRRIESHESFEICSLQKSKQTLVLRIFYI